MQVWWRRRERHAIIPRPRVYRDRRNPLETMTDNELFERYRFRGPTIEFIANGICHLLTSPTRRNKPILPIVQILLFLRFVATGSHLALIGDHLGVSESATGRACRKVCRAIWRIFSHVIRFPDGERAQRVQEEFRKIRWYVFLFNFYEYIASHRQYLQCFYFVVFSASMMLTTSDFDYAPFLTVL
jgi:hypothetical protein